MTSTEIRQQFFEFFSARSHRIVSSAPIVVKNDPTLMFTNAGMNQFKDIFIGNSTPPAPRVANTQKCLRVSGKHNDLEEVGRDTYHHTMFEMLGNWSFGDYFKREAIEWAWELLTGVYGIDPERLYATIFKGDPKEGLERDMEAEAIWKSILPADRVLAFGRKDNFWEMGATGPCGPCSEIHIDLRSEAERKKTPGASLVNTGHPQVIELWNLVFIQFNRLADESLENLPARHVDTGMGFERLTMALQGKQSTYDTDLFTPLIRKVESLTKKKYGNGGHTDVAIRVVTDHVRAVSFALADGQLPSNTGAGYVIRRILRRAVRYGFSYLGMERPFIHELVPVLARQFEQVFPELAKQLDFVSRVIREEEQNFLRTLDRGLRILDELSDKLKSGENIPGKAAFELYDTYGFPLDLTRLIAEEKGLGVDEEGFQREMEKQKGRSRQATSLTAGDWVELVPGSKGSRFVGYEHTETETRLLRYRKIKQGKQEIFQAELEETPFYAESGGQIGDTGVLVTGGREWRVVDTQKENEQILHYLPEFPENPESVVLARVDREKRRLTANNHSATHLLQAALKKVLGSHVEQKGSWVGPDYLRFDFSHFSKMSPEEIEAVEDLVNEKIRANIPRGEDRDVPFNEALKRGATALFGEKYGERVRVITFDPGFSVELCGGTHVERTGDIGLFKITAESAIAAGIRRIEAITGPAAYQWFRERARLVDLIAGRVKNKADVLKGVDNLIAENKRLHNLVADMTARQASQLAEQLKQQAKELNGIRLVAATVDLPDANALKSLVFSLRQQASTVVLLGMNQNGKALLNLGISDNLVKERNWHAGNLLRELAKAIRGGGGGQPHFASAGGSRPEGIAEAISQLTQWINEQEK